MTTKEIETTTFIRANSYLPMFICGKIAKIISVNLCVSVVKS